MCWKRRLVGYKKRSSTYTGRCRFSTFVKTITGEQARTGLFRWTRQCLCNKKYPRFSSATQLVNVNNEHSGLIELAPLEKDPHLDHLKSDMSLDGHSRAPSHDPQASNRAPRSPHGRTRRCHEFADERNRRQTHEPPPGIRRDAAEAHRWTSTSKRSRQHQMTTSAPAISTQLHTSCGKGTHRHTRQIRWGHA